MERKLDTKNEKIFLISIKAWIYPLNRKCRVPEQALGGVRRLAKGTLGGVSRRSPSHKNIFNLSNYSKLKRNSTCPIIITAQNVIKLSSKPEL